MSTKNGTCDYIHKMPNWLTSDASPLKEKTRSHRKYNFLRLLALQGSKNIYEIRDYWKNSENGDLIKYANYTTTRRYVKELKEMGMLEIKEGRRNSDVCSITGKGLTVIFIQHYLTEKDFKKAITLKSKIFAALREVGFDENVLDNVSAFNVWAYLYSLSPSMTFLEQEEYYKGEDEDYLKAKDSIYMEIIDQIEFSLISDAADYIREDKFSKLPVEMIEILDEKAEKNLVSWSNLERSAKKHADKVRKLRKMLQYKEYHSPKKKRNSV